MYSEEDVILCDMKATHTRIPSSNDQINVIENQHGATSADHWNICSISNGVISNVFQVMCTSLVLFSETLYCDKKV